MHILAAWGTVYTYELEMLNLVEYNQYRKIQVKSLDVLQIAAIMCLLCKGYTFRNEYPRAEYKILPAELTLLRFL